jgi:hypothetical protein
METVGVTVGVTEIDGVGVCVAVGDMETVGVTVGVTETEVVGVGVTVGVAVSEGVTDGLTEIVGVTVGLTEIVGVIDGVGLGLIAIVGGQNLLSSGSEDDGSPGQGLGSFAPGAAPALRHPPLTKNPLVLVRVKSKPRSTWATPLTAMDVFFDFNTALSMT